MEEEKKLKKKERNYMESMVVAQMTQECITQEET